MPKLSKVFFLLLSLLVSILSANGTAAGTSVANQAEIVYTVGSAEHNLTTNIDTFLVDQVIDLDISWQDINPVEVGAGELGRVLIFVLSNLGNGDDTIALQYEHNASSDFIPQNAQIFVDSNGNGFFEPGTDMAIHDINLSADTNATLFVVADILDSNDTGGELSHDGIRANSQRSATTGVDQQNTVDTVIRTDSDSAEGMYVIRDYWLASHKSAFVQSEDNQTHTGSIITYTIDLSIGGNATGRTIGGVVFRDVIPVGTVYQTGTLYLDGVLLSDAADVDSGFVVGTVVEVQIGTLSGTTHQEVRFDVQVQ
jgi:uncharacterized repeat protein (TIGR01451 family)